MNGVLRALWIWVIQKGEDREMFWSTISLCGSPHSFRKLLRPKVISMAAAPPPKRQKIEAAGASKSFSIDPLTRFGGPCEIIKQPVEIACFSYNKQRDMLHDTSSMVSCNCASTLTSRNTIILPSSMKTWRVDLTSLLNLMKLTNTLIRCWRVYYATKRRMERQHRSM